MRYELPWGELPRLTPPSRRPSCRGRLLARPRPRALLTCSRRWHRLLPRLLPFWPWSHSLPPMLRWPRRRYSRPAIGNLPLSRGGTRCADCRGVPMPWRRGAQNRDPSWGAATSSSRGAVPRSGVGRRSGSGPMVLRNPSSFLTTSGRSTLGTSFVSAPRQRWGRFGRPWRSYPGTFPGSSR
jgi:hypothetical protein